MTFISEYKMKVLIFGGFLGSGKTTALMQLARYIVRQSGPSDGKKVVIIENEIGEAGIDDKFLRSDGFRVEDLFAGCACCTVSGEMVDAANRIQVQYNPEWLIVETTGLAYPGLIKENLQIALNMDSRICILVDAARWTRLLLPLNSLLSGQIIGSDTVLINKADLVDETILLKTEADIAAFDPNPEVIRISAVDVIADDVWAKVLGGI
ncbi:MAG: cobalamin biosynthesis protein P47K [Firmicutes bacterium]|nr:cobalamin biosynthesis protein P47K [Bacillota bacterium]